MQLKQWSKKDLTTGLTTSYNGFALEDNYLKNTKGNRLNDNKISLDCL